MTSEEYKTLEILLDKLGSELGYRYAVIPNYSIGGVHMAIYDKGGALKDQIIGKDIKDCVNTLKT